MRSAGSVEQLYSPSYGSRTSSSQSITSKGMYKTGIRKLGEIFSATTVSKTLNITQT